MNLINIEHLNMYYATKGEPVRAVDDVSLDLDRGEALGIVGESGSGKTSLSLAIMRMIPNNVVNYSGSVILDGIDIMKLNNESFRKQVNWSEISMVFQGSMNSLNPVLKVGTQIAEPLINQSQLSPVPAMKRVAELIELVRLPKETIGRYPHELSGGMKQRAMIAMSLVLEPKLVILDEPTSALDVSIQAQMTNLLKDLKADLNISFIFITHDIALASDICDRIAVMYSGQLIEVGPSDSIFSEPQHPYTRKLLDSVPSLDALVPPSFIPGEPPDLSNPPPGCRFHPRCSIAKPKCALQPPNISVIQSRHQANCWLLEE